MKNKILGMIFGVLLCVYSTQVSFGTAATSAVNTPSRTGIKSVYGVYTNTIIYAGTMVCLNSSGYAIPAADASGNIVIGRAAKTVDNRTNATGAGDSGALTIEVERGIFGWTGNGAINADTAIGSLAYVLDDKTVTNASAGNAIIAGVVVDYSDSLVWVDTFNIGRTVGAFTTLSASGASTLTGAQTLVGATTVNNLTVSTNASIAKLTVTGVSTNTGARTGIGAATENNMTVNTNLVIEHLGFTGSTNAFGGVAQAATNFTISATGTDWVFTVRSGVITGLIKQ